MAQSSRERTIKLYLGALILLVTGMGSILAANIVISSPSKGQEFGQGEYRIKACDTWVTLDLVEGSTGLTIQGLDTKQCANTEFQIGVLDSHGIHLPLYRTDGQSQMCGQNDCVVDQSLNEEISVSIDAQGEVSLLPQDVFHNLNFDDQTGIYRVLFSQPGILANDVSRLTIQSQGI
jgi:hypothetical protein